MDYALALKLKKAGISYKKSKHSFYIDEKDIVHCRTLTGGEEFTPPNELVCVPTLSELIEACGEEFEELSGRYSNKRVHGCKWLATGIEQEPWSSKSNASGRGLTPSEAVAKLWLELNKDK